VQFNKQIKEITSIYLTTRYILVTS